MIYAGRADLSPDLESRIASKSLGLRSQILSHPRLLLTLTIKRYLPHPVTTDRRFPTSAPNLPLAHRLVSSPVDYGVAAQVISDGPLLGKCQDCACT
jgi:hypothetical protein